MEQKGWIEQSMFYPLKSKTDEFMDVWKRGALEIAKSMGAFNISIYYDDRVDAYIAVQHWEDENSFHIYSSSEELRSWSEEASRISNKPSVRHLLRVIEEAA